MSSVSLLINSLISWNDKNNVERILWIDLTKQVAFVIDINIKTYTPICRNLVDIRNDIQWGSAMLVHKDPWAIAMNESDINVSNLEKRNTAWEIVRYILDNCGEPQIYNSLKRKEYIKQASPLFGVTERTIYEYLRKYWQRGQTINSLLPDYQNCGGRGKGKKVGDTKIGRPRNDGLKGINVTEETRKIFDLAIKKYYHTTKENSLITAYELMRKEYYTEGYKYEDNVKKPILMEGSRVPSFGQFRYWYRKERSLQKEVSMRKSSKRYFLENRDVLGSSTYDVLGPGAIYQIDATIADVYLVSSYNRSQIIGRPIVYAVIDVYSRIITGIYVGLEGPSWVGAMIALSNATMDKVEYCSKYNITITEEEWPISNCIPESILADRGELEGVNIETLINGLNIKVSNTPSSRGDLKGIVERYFKTINTRIKPFVPGVVGSDFAMRGSKDYRLDAKLDLDQFTKVMIKCALYHNNKHWMDEYKRESMMVDDDIPPIPLEIWKWGISNASGKLRFVNNDVVRLNLMPRGIGTITGRGIRFKSVFYGSELALKERWFEKAKNQGSWKVEISYDPQNMDCIYIVMDNGRLIEKCFLLNHEDRYRNKTLEEIVHLIEYEKLKSLKSKDSVLQSKTDLMSDIEAIVNEAILQSKAYENVNESNAKKLKGINENRAKEKLTNREKEYWILDESEQKNKEYDKTDNEISPLDEDILLIKKMQKEKLKNE